MHVTVTLQPQDPAGLAALANAVSTPGSPQYRDYITPAEFAQRFGATPGAVQAVEASLRAHGLDPGPLSANSLSIPVTRHRRRPVTGVLDFVLARRARQRSDRDRQPAGAVARPGDRPRRPGRARARHAVDGQAAAGPRARRDRAAPPADEAHVVTGGPQPCGAASQRRAGSRAGTPPIRSPPPTGFPACIRRSERRRGGAGQTVAILELEPYDPERHPARSDACYGVNPLIANVPVDGGAGTGPGQGEAALDIENVIGLAPQARIAVYEGPNSGNGPYDTMSAIISQRAAQVVTTSWGECEQLEGFAPRRRRRTRCSRRRRRRG